MIINLRYCYNSCRSIFNSKI